MLNENLQKALVGVVIILGIFLAVQAYNGILEGKYIGRDITAMNTVTVNGKGEVFVKPDIAKISVSVVKEAKTVLEAQKQHTEAINKVVKYLKDSGIEDKDIKTTNYNIYPQYDWIESKGRVFRGYEVNQSLEVKIRNLEKVGEVFGGVTLAGANQVAGVSFVVDDEEGAKREARQKAIVDAKEKARQLEKDLGVRFSRLVSFSESNGGIYPLYKSEAMGVGGGPEIAPEIPTGENQIVVNVSLTFEIK